MFLEYFGLREDPFDAHHDSKYLFWSPSHRECLTNVFKALESGCGFAALVGPSGMGKTIMLMQLLEWMRVSARTAYVFRTRCTAEDFYRYLLAELGDDTRERDVSLLQERLTRLAREEAGHDSRIVVGVDDAHNLAAPLLESMVQLTYSAGLRARPLQVVMAGEPALADGAESPWVARLEPYNPAEVVEYIAHRLKAAGHKRTVLFTRDALAQIAEHSAGIPRRINILCYNALTRAWSARKKLIESSIVHQVVKDLGPPSTWNLSSYYDINKW
jgi:general secretion pathway protein A